MITLGIDTSGHQGSVALLRDGVLLAGRELSREGQRHARRLVPELRELLETCGYSPWQLQTIAVSVGPGSFTGLRVGVVCAKVWSYATGARLIAVDTLEAIARQSAESVTQLQVISDAQRCELFVGRFERTTEDEWTRCGEIAILPMEEWVSSLHAEDYVSGPALDKLADRLHGRCRLAPASAWYPTAQSVAALGEQAARSGHSDHVWSLEPVYLRRSAAEEKADSR